MLTRTGIAVVLGILATSLLFYIMHGLIADDRSVLDESEKVRLIDFHPIIEEPAIEPPEPPLPPPLPPEMPPDPPKQNIELTEVTIGEDIGPVPVERDPKVGPTGIPSDGDYLPIVKVAPQYPRRAQARGIEGFVLLEFTVTRTGAVQNPVVLESKPQGIFDSAAIKAALKFKYKPKVLNGAAIDVFGVRNMIRFELGE